MPVEAACRHDETAVNVGAIRGDRVDLGGCIHPAPEPFASSPARVAAHDDDVAVKGNPLTLDSQQLVLDAEDEVVTLAVRERLVGTDSQFDRSMAIADSAIAPF